VSDDPSLRTIQFEVRDLARRVGDIEDRRRATQQLHEDVRALSDTVKVVADMARRSHEALFAENVRGEFGQLGIVRQWMVGRRLFLALITIVPALVSAVFALAVYMARMGLLR
jgi:transketolase C-terminal domain/subunit